MDMSISGDELNFNKIITQIWILKFSLQIHMMTIALSCVILDFKKKWKLVKKGLSLKCNPMARGKKENDKKYRIKA